MKKTTLGDDAAIYQKREDKTEKQKWKELNSGQKKQYFMDYYLEKVIVGAVLLFVFLLLSRHFLTRKEETVLYVAVIDETLDAAGKEQLLEQLTERYVTDGDYQKVIIDDSFYTNEDALTKLETYLFSHQVDAVIADEETWREFAAYGFFRNLDEVMDGELDFDCSDDYIYTAGYRESDGTEVSFEDNETGRGEVLPYGLDISESACFTAVSCYLEDPVFAIVDGAPNLENAVDFLEYLCKE